MPNSTVRPVHFEDFGGPEFERLVFAYHVRAGWSDLAWYGASASPEQEPPPPHAMGLYVRQLDGAVRGPRQIARLIQTDAETHAAREIADSHGAGGRPAPEGAGEQDLGCAERGFRPGLI